MEKSQNDPEILSADERKLHEMCLSLNKIDAPKDFDFKLKARIASAKPSDFQPRFGFAFRYALPSLALILVLGVLAYNGGFLSPNNNPLIAESAVGPQNPELPQNSAGSSPAPSESPEQPGENQAVLPPSQSLPKTPAGEVAGIKPKRSEVEQKRKSGNDNFNGSTLESLRPATVFQPKGFEQKPVPKNIQNTGQSNPITVKEVLSTNGINANLENGRWTVKSVTANGVGESSDVKENDIIEAIDNEPLSAETVFTKTIKGQTITVTRNGEKLQLKLRSKQ